MRQPRNRPPSAFTPARLALVRELWPTATPTAEIVAKLAALPGLQPVRATHVRRWAQIAHVTRPPEICVAERAATRRANRVVIPANAPPHWRHEALCRLAAGQWTVERLTDLCDFWDAGHTVTAIAERLFITSNTVSGRIHRLQARGLIEGRASPIIRNGAAPTPKKVATPAPLPAPIVTLPPLASVAAVGGCGPLAFNQSLTPPRPATPLVAAPAPLGNGKCLFPKWPDNAPPTHQYCHKPTPLGSSFCPDCRAIVFYRARAA